MMDTATKRYAQAVFDISKESGIIELVQNDFRALSALIDASLELSEFLQNPVIPLQKRQEIIRIILKKGFHKLTHQFILFLSKKGRLNCLKDICTGFEHICLAEAGIVSATITSSLELDSRQTDEISKHLQFKLGKKINLNLAVDPKLLGGVKIQQGGTISEYSFRSQLERFHQNLIRA